MQFRDTRNSQTSKGFRLGEVEIKTEKYKYLGIILDVYLNYNTTADYVVLLPYIVKLEILKTAHTTLIHIFFLLAYMPNSHYSSSMWGYKQFSKCQNVQNKAMRHLLDLNKFSPNLMPISDMAWMKTVWIPSHILIKLNMIKLWNKICNLNET